LNGSEVKIADDGEVLMRGGHIFKGYLKNEEATRETIDSEGWLHSGDIGNIDEHGFISITDRKKEILITAGGENIAPTMIEGKLKSIDVIDQAVVIGDQRKYLTALLVLDEEGLADAAAELGSDAKDMASAVKCEKFRAHVQAEVERVNEDLARVQTIKKWTLLPQPLSVENEELTPTMKLKRRIVNEHYAGEIEAMY
ncbi:MAG: AMP-binding protein, partial [Salinisphaeraceae bacterium]|nr:AMP-binding protein [Salinisphaeraceae bacterium]